MVREVRVSGWGSVCERGVEGLREVMLSSEVLLSWRARVLLSPMVSAEGWLELELELERGVSCIGALVGVGVLFGP